MPRISPILTDNNYENPVTPEIMGDDDDPATLALRAIGLLPAKRIPGEVELSQAQQSLNAAGLTIDKLAAELHHFVTDQRINSAIRLRAVEKAFAMQGALKPDDEIRRPVQEINIVVTGGSGPIINILRPSE